MTFQRRCAAGFRGRRDDRLIVGHVELHGAAGVADGFRDRFGDSVRRAPFSVASLEQQSFAQRLFRLIPLVEQGDAERIPADVKYVIGKIERALGKGARGVSGGRGCAAMKAAAVVPYRAVPAA